MTTRPLDRQDDSLDSVDDETRAWHIGPGKRVWTARGKR